MTQSASAVVSHHWTNYSVYRRRPRWQTAGLQPDQSKLTDELEGFVAELAARDAEVLGFYDASAFRGDDDLIVWFHTRDAKVLQDVIVGFERTQLAASLLERTWTATGMAAEQEFAKEHLPSFILPQQFPRRQWLTIYPFVRSYEWYLLPEEERRELLRDHGALGHQFPQINGNTVANFAIGDWEWLLSFEADQLNDLVDMMRHLRYSKARLHVRDELPFHVGRRLASPQQVVARLA